jgi:hypothetical protein
LAINPVISMLNDLKNHLGSSVESVRRLFQRPAPAAADERRGSARDARLRAREEHHRRVRLMRRELYQLMEQHPTSRDLMRHLDLVERTLRQEGFSAVQALPVRVIARALQQLEQLVWDWTPAGLAELRSRLAVIVRTRAVDAPARSGAAPSPAPTAKTGEPELGGALVGPAVGDATEIDHAEFAEMERSWSGQMPADVRDALAAARPA